MGFAPSRPLHNRFLFKNLNETQYNLYVKQYSKAKAGGIRCVYAWMNGVGAIGVVTDVSQGIVIDYGKRKFAAFCLNAGAYVFSPAVVVVTNATRFVKISKNIHSTAAFCFECVEDSTNLAFVPLDFALFGQPVSIGASFEFAEMILEG